MGEYYNIKMNSSSLTVKLFPFHFFTIINKSFIKISIGIFEISDDEGIFYG